jgi:hypothetical protein
MAKKRVSYKVLYKEGRTGFGLIQNVLNRSDRQ